MKNKIVEFRAEGFWGRGDKYLAPLAKDLEKTINKFWNSCLAQHERIQNQILYSENRIDELVFDLYGLSKKDIEIIKNNLP